MKKILGLSTLALAGVLAFTGCSCNKETEKTATAYGIVHKDYLGVATVTHTGNDVTAVSFDEVMLPNTWAKVTVGSTAATSMGTKTGTLTAPGTDDVFDGFARFIKIGDTYFRLITAVKQGVESRTTYGTAGLNGSGTAALSNYQSGTFTNGTFTADDQIRSLYNYLKTDEGGKWYYDAMTAGNYDVLKADGTSLELTYTGGKGAAALKSTNDYGNNPGHVFKWGDNMTAIATYLVENDNLGTLNVYKYSKNFEADGVKYFGTSDTDVVTGATLTDFADYVYLAQVAFNK